MHVRIFTSKGPLSGVPRFRVRTKAQSINIDIIQPTLEEEINAWLAMNPAIRIVEIRQSVGNRLFGPPYCVVSVWYEPARVVLDRKAAEELVLKHLNEFKPECRQGDTVITEVLDKPFGWVFFYNSKQYSETGDSKHAMLGNCPILVDARDATLHVLGGLDFQTQIETYEKTGTVG